MDFPEIYADFKRNSADLKTDVLWEEYEKDNHLISVSGNDKFRYRIAATKNLTSFSEEEDVTLENLAVFNTVEEAWEFMKGWMDKNTLRATL